VKRFGLPRTRRLTLKKDFKSVLETGSKTADSNFTLWWKRRSGEGGGRLGIIVSKRLIGCAVKRNRAKRLIREAFRLNGSKIAEGTDVIVYPRTDKALNDFGAAQKAVFGVWRKAGIVSGGL